MGILLAILILIVVLTAMSVEDAENIFEIIIRLVAWTLLIGFLFIIGVIFLFLSS